MCSRCGGHNMSGERQSLRDRKIEWKRTLNGQFPYRVQVDNQKLVIRINDFPSEPLYSLLIDDEPVEHFDEWPDNWSKDPQEIRHEVIDRIIDIEANLNRIFEAVRHGGTDDSIATLWQDVETDVSEMGKLMDQLQNSDASED